MAKVRKIIIFGIFIILILCSLTWATSLKKTTYGPFIFYYDPPDSLLVQHLIQKIEGPWRHIETLFHEALTVPVSVRLTKSDAEFFRFLHDRVPEWSQAVALPYQRMIVLRLSDAEQIHQSPQILLHELMHILLYDYLQNVYLPTWLNEGLAEYFSQGGLNFEKKLILAQAIVQKKIIDFGAIDSLLQMKGPQARLSYVESQSAVEYIAREYGEQKLVSLIKAIGREKNFKRAFYQTFGFDLLDFEIQWNEYIKQKYRWLVMLRFEELIFALSGVLFLIAVLVVYLRNKRKLKALTVEEQDEPNEGGL